jgi:hypothetical protein
MQEAVDASQPTVVSTQCLYVAASTIAVSGTGVNASRSIVIMDRAASIPPRFRVVW